MCLRPQKSIPCRPRDGSLPTKAGPQARRNLEALLLAALGVLAVPASGCIEGFDAFLGSDEAYYRLNDYRIDRPRVLAVTQWPPQVSSETLIEFSALAATPGELINPDIEWWGCGLSIDVPFYYWGDDCLGSSVAEYLGKGPSVTVRLPLYDVSSCVGEESCNGRLPVFAMVRDSSFDPDTGFGVTSVRPSYLAPVPPAPYDSATYQESLTLRVDGEAESSPRAAQGARVSLEATVYTDQPDILFSWYVSDGALEQLGLTSAEQINGSGTPAYNWLTGRNTLRVPEAFKDAFIQVYVVVSSEESGMNAPVRFATRSIEVTQ